MRDNRESFSQKLRTLRRAADITQEQLAAELGISRSCLSNYESGMRQPDHDMVRRIADRFDVLTDYLMCRTEYCNIPIEKSKIEELHEINCRVNRHGDTIDISGISINKKIAIIEFCKFIICADEGRLST